MSIETPLLECTDVVVGFPHKRGKGVFYAVQKASLSVGAGEVVGLVGESGSGKSTLARAIVGLQPPDAGNVVFDGRQLGNRRSRTDPPGVQVGFKDPYASIDPRMSDRPTPSGMDG